MYNELHWCRPCTRSRFYESSQQRYANVATVTWLVRHFETVKFPITSSPRARPSNWANAELYRYKIVAVSLHKTHICVVKSLVKIAAVSWHSLRRFIKPAPGVSIVLNATYINKMSFYWLNCYQAPCHASSSRLGTSLLSGQCSSSIFVLCGCVNGWTLDSSCVLCGMLIRC